MRRRLLHLTAVASLLIFILIALLTTRSLMFGIADTVSRATPTSINYVESIDGKMLLSFGSYTPKPRSAPPRPWSFHSVRAHNYRPSDQPWFDFGGLAFCHAPPSRVMDSRTYLMVPAWLSLPITAALPAFGALGALARRRSRHH